MARTYRMPDWVKALQVRLYLFLMNRLYLDALSTRLRGWCHARHGSPRAEARSFLCCRFARRCHGAVLPPVRLGIPHWRSYLLFGLAGSAAAAFSPAWTLYRRADALAGIFCP